MNNIYKNIKVASFDVDGTITDGMYQVNKFGDVVKSFNTRDFQGIQKLLENDIRVVILTQSHDEVIFKQVDRIASHSDIWYKSIFEGETKLIIKVACNDKKEYMERYLKKHSLTFENLAHMGDAENDIELLEAAGVSACPLDSIEEIQNVNFISSKKGGEGAVYEFCKYLLKMKEKE